MSALNNFAKCKLGFLVIKTWTAIIFSIKNKTMDSRLFMTKNLLAELRKTSGYDPKNPLITYINFFNMAVGLDQTFTVNMAKRLGFDLGLERYINNKDITLREVFYYEMLNYIMFYEANRHKLKLPKTEVLINIKEHKFKKFYNTLYVNKEYYKKYYDTRLSMLTDYIMFEVDNKS